QGRQDRSCIRAQSGPVEVIQDVERAGAAILPGAVKPLAAETVERPSRVLAADDRSAERPAASQREIAAEPELVGLLFGVCPQVGPFGSQPRNPRLGAVHPRRVKPRELDAAKPVGLKPFELKADVLAAEWPGQPPPPRVGLGASTEIRRRRRGFPLEYGSMA